MREQDLNAEARQEEQMRAWLETAQDELGKIVAVGEGPSGHVKVAVDPNGQVLEVAFDPRAMRLGSSALADEVLEAVRRGREEAERQAHDLMREAMPGFDPVEANARFERLLNPESGW
ncbi:YbaB/EbfC family nucleoid-associated protein [Nonomuraea jiangxiensis]|uniref:Conserved DNA-binding protein YbaB n=1 Tax=Nonomuraea jiangxiensis TaxID=633440 RepID=A0A1G8SYU8_9ACTN|nr:YbaB/EbfC family nucleoid-associated protein [Nonomuraea jiangxiensis]SDJ34431.1 Conserved DNA-binding protein YbaB [Nonomuraea jiangxiensis]